MANNIINVSFGCVTRKTITLKWQYDEGQIISFDDITLPTTFECHFANTGDSTAERYLGQNNQVEIPAKYFWSGRPIDCYVVTVDQDSKQTAYKLTINVYNRPPQDGIEPSGDQEDIIEQAINALNTAVGRSEAAAQNAEESAQDAEESAQAIQNMTVDANTLTTGSEATVTKSVDPETGVVNLTFGIPEGEQGPTGPKGDKGDTGATGVTGATGPQGPQGVKGDTGATPAFSIGTVSTLEPGASATASITGTSENPVLNLGIPKGAKGDTGEVSQAEFDDLSGTVSNLNRQISTKSIYPFAPDATIFNSEYDGTNAQKIARAVLNVEFYDVPENYKYHIESTYLNGTLSGNPYTQIAIKGVRNDGAVNARAFLYTDNSASHTGIEQIIVPPVAGFSGYVIVTVDFTDSGFNAAPTFEQCKLSQQCFREKRKKRLLVLGDSWSDTDTTHTNYTKWPALLAATGRYEVINYAQNGSSISGDTPNFGLNGNVAGQMQQMTTDNVQNIDIVVIFGGINDFRGTVSNQYVYNKISEFVTTLKARYTGVRIIYISNNQLYITQQQIDYFNGIIDYARNIIGIEAFDTFGWCYPGYYLNDFVHVNNDGYKSLAANIMSILEGGTIRRVTIKYHKTGGGETPDIDLIESWEEGKPHYSCKMNVPSALLGQAFDISFDAASPSTRFILASVPFCKEINKGYVTETGKPTGIMSCEIAETFSTVSRLNTTNVIKFITPNANSGSYFSDSFN